jgi:Flp pilus assembly protein TadB
MHFDKPTIALGALAVAATIVLGALAGALAGVLAALAGAVFVVVWQIATGHQSRVQEKGELLDAAASKRAPPAPAQALMLSCPISPWR